MITDFKDKKLVEYLRPGQKVLIRFGHGLGDTIMFMPLFKRLIKLYPDVQFKIYLESGQEMIWDCEKDKDSQDYDLVFSLNFPMAEGSNQTKAQKCAIEELGITPIDIKLNPLPYYNPLVAVHFNGTALPNAVSCPNDVAKQIWEEIIDAGYIPIETHFEHMFHNPVNTKFDFINRDIRTIPADIQKLIGLLSNSHAFIGVASGNLMVALSNIPDKTMYLQKDHKMKNYISKEVPTIDVYNYKSNTVKEWLSTL